MEKIIVICDMTGKKLNKDLIRLRKVNERQQHELEKNVISHRRGGVDCRLINALLFESQKN